MKLKMTLAGALVAGMGLAGAPSNAAPTDEPIVALPASHETATFGLPNVQSSQGTAVTFANLDPLALHSVVSVATDHTKRAWCTNAQAFQGTCEKFKSALIAAGETLTVPGTAALAPGAYEFYCIPHGSSMRATLEVVAA